MSYNNLEQALGLTDDGDYVEENPIAIIEPPTRKISVDAPDQNQDVTDDLDYVRNIHHTLLEQGGEALKGAMELAREGASPRSYEVVAGLMKTISETGKELLELQNQVNKIKTQIPEENTSTTVTNNKVFVGSSSDLLDMLANKENVVNE